MKNSKKSHTADAKTAMGDFYGSGIRAKVGRMRQMFSPGENVQAPKKLKKPPKTLA